MFRIKRCRLYLLGMRVGDSSQNLVGYPFFLDLCKERSRAIDLSGLDYLKKLQFTVRT